MSDESEPECTGQGKCHGCLKWCSTCGDVGHICDTRLRGELCSEHPVPLPANVIRVERRVAERMIAEGRRMVREGEEVLAKVVDWENARRAYVAQMAEEERRMFEIPQEKP
jgi:predicted metal-binding transcription factor (methanogenesis marker protein 9)